MAESAEDSHQLLDAEAPNTDAADARGTGMVDARHFLGFPGRPLARIKYLQDLGNKEARCLTDIRIRIAKIPEDVAAAMH